MVLVHHKCRCAVPCSVPIDIPKDTVEKVQVSILLKRLEHV